MAIHDLPTEVVRLIFESLATPKQLYSLIAASSHCWRVYATAPEAILGSIIKSLVPPEILHEYAAISYARHLVIKNRPASLSALATEPFLDRYLGLDTFELPKTKNDLVALYQLQSWVDYFANEFYQSATSALYSTRSESTTTEAPQVMSECERLRISRAFLRFELYCQLYGGDQTVKGLHQPRDQFRLFLSRLPVWEVEELCCTQQYLTHIVSAFIDNLELEFEQAVLATPGLQKSRDKEDLRGPEYFLPRRSSMHEKADELVELSDLDLTSLGMFSTDGKRNSYSYISNIASLGLGFLFRLVHSNAAQQSVLLRSNYRSHTSFLPEALLHAPDRASRTIKPQNLEENNTRQANLGYYLYKGGYEDVYPQILQGGFVKFPLRALGYVFWDHDRISSPTVLKAFSRSRFMNYDELCRRFTRLGKESAEFRLAGVRVPAREMDKLERNFGFVRYISDQELRRSYR